MYKSYVIPVGAMSVCWRSKKKLTAGAWMLMAGEQLCRRVVSTQIPGTRVEVNKIKAYSLKKKEKNTRIVKPEVST